MLSESSGKIRDFGWGSLVHTTIGTGFGLLTMDMHRRILLIDDSRVTRKALKAVLGLHQEWEIVGEAENGRKGLELVQRSNPDVVIVDFQMPGMNGIEVGKEIRRTHPGVLMILFTLHAGREIEVLARKAGFDGVLSKAAPYPIVAIIEMMKASKANTESLPEATSVHPVPRA